MTTRVLLITALLTLFVSVCTQAQTQSYSCDFEDLTENGSWVLRSGVQAENAANKWYIDQAANNVCWMPDTVSTFSNINGFLPDWV
jgi:hypothetical protein